MGKIVRLLIVASLFPVFSLAQDCTLTIPLRVVDRDTAAPLEPLTAEMITAKMGETRLLISAAARIRSGRIIVLIDESGSMAAPGRAFSLGREAIRAVKQTLSDLVGKLPPGVSIEYGLFNKKWVFSDTFLSDPAELRKSIDEVTVRFGKAPYGGTAIYDSLHEALKRFGAPQIGDSILLLTDGGDNASEHGVKELEREFRASQARLLTMMVYDSFPPTPEVAGSRVQDLVEKTGGSTLAVNPESPAWADSKNTLRNTEMIRRFWNERVLTTDVIQVQVPATVKKEARWKLTVNPEADARLKHAVVIYPDRLGPCPLTMVTEH